MSKDALSLSVSLHFSLSLCPSLSLSLSLSLCLSLINRSSPPPISSTASAIFLEVLGNLKKAIGGDRRS